VGAAVSGMRKPACDHDVTHLGGRSLASLFFITSSIRGIFIFFFSLNCVVLLLHSLD
jgi:hypothetical protein